MTDHPQGQQELAACPTPWCDHSDTPYVWQGVDDRYSVICATCQVEGPSSDTKAEAIAAWNTRSPASSVSSEGVEPVGYVCPEHLARRGEYERNGSTIYDRPLGTYTTPVYALSRPASRDDEGLVERLRNVSIETCGSELAMGNYLIEQLPAIIAALSGSLADEGGGGG